MSKALEEKIKERLELINEIYLEWEIKHPNIKPPPIIFEEDVME